MPRTKKQTPPKKQETQETSTSSEIASAVVSEEAQPSKPEVFYGVWYVMKRNWSGWELYKRTPETVARCFEHSEFPGRVRYEVFGADTAGGPLICEIDSFVNNVVRPATDEDAKLRPRDPQT